METLCGHPYEPGCGEPKFTEVPSCVEFDGAAMPSHPSSSSGYIMTEVADSCQSDNGEILLE